MMGFMAFGYLQRVKKSSEETENFDTFEAAFQFVFEQVKFDTTTYFVEWVLAFVLTLTNLSVACLELFMIIYNPRIIYTDSDSIMSYDS